MYTMTFVELSPFTRHVYRYLTDEEYQGVQRYLLNFPDAGVLIPGTGGAANSGGQSKAGAKVAVYASSITGGALMMKSGC